MSQAKLIITSGEPAGIGPDLIALLDQKQFNARLIVISDQQLLEQRAKNLGKKLNLVPYNKTTIPTAGSLEIIHQPLNQPAEIGKLNVKNAKYVLECIKKATLGCLYNEFDAIVTGPIQKDIINDAGIAFTGHTEYLAELCDTPLPLMMLATDSLRVALVTIHMPLKDVSDAITQDKIKQIAAILDTDLKSKYGIKRPHIKVCGLNPHAGENGYLGHEEIDTIIPAIQSLKQTMHITGPYPADTVFTQQHLKDADVVLAMYHDQGLPVLKHSGFGNAINTTLGLPIIRTSVDHGTALDKAGSHDIDSGSLHAAIHTAIHQSHFFHS